MVRPVTRRPHPKEPVHHTDPRSGRLRELVFGLEDGLVSTLGVITGVATGTGNRLLVILTGLVVIFVEALSMGAGSYLSNKSESELEDKMLREELHEIRTQPDKERQELREWYTKRGFTAEEQEILIARFMADEELLLEEMAHKELGIHPEHEEHPGGKAVIMWGAYMVGGSVPIVPYLFAAPPVGIAVSVAGTLVALFGVGYWKGATVDIHPVKSGFEMLLVAGAAAGVGYVVGAVAGHLLGISGGIH